MTRLQLGDVFVVSLFPDLFAPHCYEAVQLHQVLALGLSFLVTNADCRHISNEQLQMLRKGLVDDNSS